jgi:predicted permease
MKPLRLAFRTLFKSPFVTGVAVLSLALGIGANAAIYSIFDQMLLRALPVQEPGRLVNLGTTGMNFGSTSCNQSGSCDELFSYPMFRDLEAAEGPFEAIAAHRIFGANLAGTGATTSGTGILVSGSYFPVLGVRPALGRLFTPEDDREIGAHPVVVLSHGYWQNDLGADPEVLNRSIVVNGISMTIVGVTQRGFTGTTLGSQPDVFVPLTMRAVVETYFHDFDRRNAYWAYLFARLKPGVEIEKAAEEINATFSAIVQDVEAPLLTLSAQNLERFRQKRILLSEGQLGQSNTHREVRTPLRLLMAITVVVLLIACANIANLLLARGANRAQEMAVRNSLGAGRASLLRQLLSESMVLALSGGLLSILVAYWTLQAVGGIMGGALPDGVQLGISPPIVLFAAVVSMGTGLLFGLYPALIATRVDLVTQLKAGGGQPSAARSAQRFRALLVTAQIALSMTLLVAAGLFTRSLANVGDVDLGMRTESMIVFGLSPIQNGYDDADSRALFTRVEEALAATPGVSGVTASLVPVISGSNWGNDVNVQGFEGGLDVDQNARFNQVGPGYFGTMGMALLAGREFDAADVDGASKVAIVNEAFTRKFGLDGANAVGKFMSEHTGEEPELDIEIVGVVQDAKYSAVKLTVPPLFFLPYRQALPVGLMNFYVRTALPPEEIMPEIPRIVASLDPNLPVERFKTLETVVDENIMLDRTISQLAAAFAVLATLLAAVGLYGVLAYSVAQRTREIGVRMALGARGDRVRRMVMGQVGRMSAVGAIVGLIAALALSRVAETLLFGVDAKDPVVIVLVVALLAVVTGLAGYLPARRASRVDPVIALRYQ